jgi:hypothetical protein
VTLGSSPTNVTVSVMTTAPSSGTPRAKPVPLVPPLLAALSNFAILALFLAGLAWPVCLWRWLRYEENRRWMAVLLPAAGLFLALLITGCGGGGGGSGSGSTNPGTSAGTYTLTVTGTTGSGSSTLSHSVTLTLKVS